MKEQRTIVESIILFYSRILWNSTLILDISPEFSGYKHASEKQCQSVMQFSPVYRKIINFFTEFYLKTKSI